MNDIKIAKKLKSLNENEWYTYYMAEVPWPFNDRDIIYLVKLVEIEESAIITLESKPDFAPKAKAYIRIKSANGKWVFTPMNDNKTQILYQFYTDPGISMPLWIMNLIIVEGPYNTIKGLKEMAKSEKHNSQ